MPFFKQETKTITLSTFLFRVTAAFFGGVGGMLSFFFVFLFAGTLIPGNKENPLSLFIMLAMAFIGTMLTNLLSTFFIAYADPEKFKSKTKIAFQVFMANIILFIFSIPLYLIASQAKIQLSLPAVIHLLLSTQISSLILEMFSTTKHTLVRVYGIALGSLISFGIVLLFFSIRQENLVVFIIMPLFWSAIEFCGGLADFIYDAFSRSFEIDVFSEK